MPIMSELRSPCDNDSHPHIQVEICQFNSSHWILKHQMPHHLLNCPDNYVVTKGLHDEQNGDDSSNDSDDGSSYSADTGSPSLSIEGIDAAAAVPAHSSWNTEEEWITDGCSRGAYNPRLKLIFIPQKMKVPECLSKSKKKEFYAMDDERVKQLRENTPFSPEVRKYFRVPEGVCENQPYCVVGGPTAKTQRQKLRIPADPQIPGLNFAADRSMPFSLLKLKKDQHRTDAIASQAEAESAVPQRRKQADLVTEMASLSASSVDQQQKPAANTPSDSESDGGRSVALSKKSFLLQKKADLQKQLEQLENEISDIESTLCSSSSSECSAPASSQKRNEWQFVYKRSRNSSLKANPSYGSVASLGGKSVASGAGRGIFMHNHLL